MPVYLVKDADSDVERLVRAARPITAINHVIGTRFSTDVATVEDGLRLAPKGVVIEDAGETQPEPAPMPNGVSSDGAGMLVNGTDDDDPPSLPDDWHVEAVESDDISVDAGSGD